MLALALSPKLWGPFLPHIWDSASAWAPSFHLSLPQFPSWCVLEGLGYSPLIAPKHDLEATDTVDWFGEGAGVIL